MVHYLDGYALLSRKIDAHLHPESWQGVLGKSAEAQFEDHPVLLVDYGTQLQVFVGQITRVVHHENV
jgi:hypothetical protein